MPFTDSGVSEAHRSVLDEAKNDEGQRGGPRAVKNKNGWWKDPRAISDTIAASIGEENKEKRIKKEREERKSREKE